IIILILIIIIIFIFFFFILRFVCFCFIVSVSSVIVVLLRRRVGVFGGWLRTENIANGFSVVGRCAAAAPFLLRPGRRAGAPFFCSLWRWCIFCVFIGAFFSR